MKIKGNESGQGLSEYLILLFLISIVCVVSVREIGSLVKGKLEKAQEKLQKNLIIGE